MRWVKYWREISSALIISIGSFLIIACSSNPVGEADTFEQKAYASYGVYVIYQGKAAKLKQDPSVPESVKRILSRTDFVAYPASLVLLDAAITVTDIRETLEACQTRPPTPEVTESCKNTSEEKLSIALSNLSKIYFDAKPKLLALKTAFDSAKTPTRTP